VQFDCHLGAKKRYPKGKTDRHKSMVVASNVETAMASGGTLLVTYGGYKLAHCIRRDVIRVRHRMRACFAAMNAHVQRDGFEGEAGIKGLPLAVANAG
jgi:hypothetical protein